MSSTPAAAPDKALLCYGMQGPRVEAVQRLLVRAGYLSPAKLATGPGIFGPATLTAVKAFQKAHLPAGSSSGTVDRRTLEALSKARPAGAPSANSSRQRTPATSPSALDAIWSWLCGTLQGDFNKNPTLSQIGVNVLLGLVPLVDQVLDVRDIIAGLKDLIEYYMEDEAEQKRHPGVLGLNYELWLWINVFIIALGCIPEVGSVAKGVLWALLSVLKQTTKGAGALTPKQLQQLWRKTVQVLGEAGISERKAVEVLTRLSNQLTGWMGHASTRIKSTLDAIQRLLNRAEGAANSWPARTVLDGRQLKLFIANIRGIKNAIQKAYKRLDQMKVEVNQWLRNQLSHVLKGKPASLPGSQSVGSLVPRAQKLAQARRTSLAAAAQAKVQYQAAAQELGKSFRAARGRLYSTGLDAELLLKVSKTAYFAAKAGITEFDVFLKDLKVKKFFKDIDFDGLSPEKQALVRNSFDDGVARASSEFSVKVPYKGGHRELTFDASGSMLLDGKPLPLAKYGEIYKQLDLTHAYKGHGPQKDVKVVANEARLNGPSFASGKFSSDEAFLKSVMEAQAAFKAGKGETIITGDRLITLEVPPTTGRAFMRRSGVPAGVKPMNLRPFEQLDDVVELEVTHVRALLYPDGSIRSIYPIGGKP